MVTANVWCEPNSLWGIISRTSSSSMVDGRLDDTLWSLRVHTFVVVVVVRVQYGGLSARLVLRSLRTTHRMSIKRHRRNKRQRIIIAAAIGSQEQFGEIGKRKIAAIKQKECRERRHVEEERTN